MAIAHARLVDLSVTRWHHCVTRCVRKALLLGEGRDRGAANTIGPEAGPLR